MSLKISAIAVLAILSGGGSVIAQIVPDETLGNERSQVIENAVLNGQPLTVRINGTDLPVDVIVDGARRGNNLFHSFAEFNVAADRGTYFFSPDSQVQNIFARVTGSNPSEILGRLGTLRVENGVATRSGANLFLINPNGILFGQNASLEVNGSFLATTASAVRFGDDSFSATNPQVASDVLRVEPSAFLFSQVPAGDVIVRSNASASPGSSFFGLEVPNGKNLTLLGGSVNIEGGQLNAFGGRVEIGAIAGVGEVGLNPNGSLSVPGSVKRADVLFNNAAKVDVSFRDKGDVGITANNISLVGQSRILAGIDDARGTAESQAGDLTIDSTGIVELSESSRIANSVNQNFAGNGGSLEITAESLVVTDSSRINANTRGTGNAGNVTVKVQDRVSLSGASAIFSSVEGGAIGNGGDLSITANTLELRDGSGLTASTFGIGNAGSITVQVLNQVLLDNSNILSTVGRRGKGEGGNLFISANTLDLSNGAQFAVGTFGIGNAGNVTVEVRDRISLNGNSAIFSRVEPNATAKGGNLSISANTLNLSNGAQISASNLGTGDAGDITIAVRDRVSLSAGNLPTNKTGTVELGQSSRIENDVTRSLTGNISNLKIAAGSLVVTDGSQISSSNRGTGNAGNVTVDVREHVSLNGNQTAILSNTAQAAIGNGGNLSIIANTLDLTNGAQLVANTRGTGNAGNVTVKVRDRVSLSGASVIFSSVEEGAVGNGGDLSITANTLELRDGSGLTAGTFGTGNAGSITVQVLNQVLLDSSDIFGTVGERGNGQGGNLFLSANTLNLSNGAQFAVGTFGIGSAGNVTVEVRDRISLSGDQTGILNSIEEGAIGNGGNLSISANTLNLSNGAQISASTRGQGNAGSIFLGKDDQPISSVLISGANTSGRSSALFAFTDSDRRSGGNIRIFADRFRLSDGAVVDARTFASGSSGTISLNANLVEILRGGQFLAVTQGSGSSGQITIAANQLRISGTDSTFEQRRTDFTTRVAPVSPESGIYTRSIGSGSAGSIFVTGSQIQLDDRARIDAQSATVGGGDINIRASDRLVLRNNSQISATAGTAEAPGDGGNIDITARFLIAIPKENSDIAANAFQGRGGNVTIATQGGILGFESRSRSTPLSDITASSEVGISGTVTLNTPDTNNLQNSLTQLPQSAIDTNALLANSCIVRNPQNGTFFITGTGGLPTNPGELSTYSTGTIQPTTAWKPGDAIVEPQGVYQLPDGQLVMSRECD